jgi:PPP family 3-phenylpropionic acid transporter
VAFILANVIGGRVMAVAQPVISVIWSAVAAASAAVGALTLLPRTPVRAEGEPVHAEESPFAAITSLIRNPALLLVFLTASLVQGGHAMVYGFSTLDWTHQGLSSALVGLLWGISVAAEVIFFWFGEGFRRRMGGAGLLLLGAVAGVIRWTALALSPPVWLLFPIQCLHAFSFCASFTGTLELVDRLSPRQHVSAAQMLAASASFGFSTGVATIACGWLYGQFGAHAYLAMAAMALAAVVCAIRLVRVAPAHGQSAL